MYDFYCFKGSGWTIKQMFFLLFFLLLECLNLVTFYFFSINKKRDKKNNAD